MKFFLIFQLLFFQLVFAQKKFNFESIQFNLSNRVERLNEQEKKKLYNNKFDIPDVIFLDKNANASIAFKKTIANIPIGGLRHIKESFIKQFQHPKITIVRDDIIQIDNKDFILANVEIDSPNEVINITNLSTDIEGNMVMITISYMDYSNEWKKITKNFIDSIKVLK